MILQIDHIAISSDDFERDLEFMESVGYNLEFVERNIENLKMKKALMNNFSETQSLALFRKENSLGIEILHHGTLTHNKSYIQPIFEGILPEIEKKYNAEKIGYISRESDSNFKFDKLAIKTCSLKQSKDFWEYFGFKQIQNKPIILEFNSILSGSSCQVYLKKTNSCSSHFLDDRGFSVIAFITNSIKREWDTLKSKEIKVTDIECLTLNNKNLEIFFALGPSGELVEVVGLEMG